MDNKEKAIELFEKKFNCSQSVFGALAEEAGIDRETALKTAACFGSGMRCGEACGAVTGALMALGIRFGSVKENDAENKAAVNQRSVTLSSRFKEKHNTILCRELLGFNPAVPEDAQKIRELDLHNKLCKQLITSAVEIAEEIIAQG